ncbi:MAG TPA: hypothetical protein PLU17_13770 [Chitinophagaceae bacterium]|jgi:hypothetical protein|nr:hypothetical protein [Chitinophagaceae bacterium]
MLRFLFYLAFGYIILKIFRIFIDPLFSTKTVKNTSTEFVPKQEEKKSKLGDYVEFEEVK